MSATATITAMANALKTVYKTGLKKDIFDKLVLYKLVSKDLGTADSRGESVTYKHQYGRTSGVGSIPREGILPNPGVGKYVESTVPMKATYGTISLSDFAIEATKNREAAIVSLLDSEMVGIKDTMKREITRQWYSAGTGEIAKVNGIVSNSTTVVLDNPVAGPHATWFLMDGQYIRLDDTSTTVAGSGNVRQIASVDSPTQITLTAAVTAADNDIISVAQVNGSTYQTSYDLASTDVEMMGLSGIVDDATLVSTFQGLSRTTYPWMKGNVVDASSAAITEELMDQAMLEAAKWGEVDKIITNPKQFNKYGQTLVGDRRYNAGMKYDGGFTSLSYQGIPVIKDYDCPVGKVFFLDTATIAVEELTPIGWMEEDGSVLNKASDNTASYTAVLRYYANLGCTKPRANAVIENLLEA